MNFHHLRIFQSVARSGSTVGASESLLISQSAISSQLKQLEASLGVSLFDRAPTGMLPTEAGDLLLEYANRIFTLANEATVGLADLHRLKRGNLRIGATPTIGTYFLPPLLVHFQRRFPQIELYVETGDADVLEARLDDGSIEVAFTPTSSAASDMTSRRFMQDELIAVVANQHPLARQRKVTPTELAVALVGRRLPSATGSLVQGYFAGRKISVKPLILLGSVEAMKQAAVAGLGATIVSKMSIVAELEQKRLKILQVDGLPLRRPLYTVRKDRPASKAATAFDCLLKHAVRGSLPKLKPIT